MEVHGCMICGWIEEKVYGSTEEHKGIYFRPKNHYVFTQLLVGNVQGQGRFNWSFVQAIKLDCQWGIDKKPLTTFRWIVLTAR